MIPFEPDDIPTTSREPGARVPAASLDPLDALNLLVLEQGLPPAYRAALRRRVDVAALPWLAISDAWEPEQLNPARARTIVAGVEPGPLQAPLRRPMVVDVGGRDVLVGGADTLAALVAAGVTPLNVWREK